MAGCERVLDVSAVGCERVLDVSGGETITVVVGCERVLDVGGVVERW